MVHHNPSTCASAAGNTRATGTRAQRRAAARTTRRIDKATTACAARSGKAADTPVQRHTDYASTPGHSGEDRERRAKAAATFTRLNALQKDGYAIAGLESRTKVCGTIAKMPTGTVALGVTKSGGVQIKGLNRCASRWCARCWSKIASNRAGDLEAVAQWALTSGHTVAMFTLTAAHVARSVLAEAKGSHVNALMTQDLKDLLKRMTGAWRTMHSGRAGQHLTGQRVGYARATEFTLDNLYAYAVPSGVHMHFHVLMVLEPVAGQQHAETAKQYGDELYNAWSRACDKQDLDTSRQGFDTMTVTSAKEVAGYLAKTEAFQDTDDNAAKIALEMTNTAAKQGRGGRRCSPEELLRNITRAKDEGNTKMVARLIAQWREFETATKGMRWLTWSRDLRKLAGIGVELTEEEAAAIEEDTVNGLVAEVPFAEVAEHVNVIRAVVLEAEDDEKWETLLMALDSFGIPYRVATEAEWDHRMSEVIWASSRH